MPDFSLQQSLDDLGLFNLPPASSSSAQPPAAHSTASSSRSTDGTASSAIPLDGSPAAAMTRDSVDKPLGSNDTHHGHSASGSVSSNAGGAHPLNAVYPGAGENSSSSSSSEDPNATLQQLVALLGGGNGVEQRQASAPQLSLHDIQRLLLEKEHSDRLQNLQTALLRQQLEALQRARQNPQVMQQLPQQLQSSQSSVQQLLAALQGGHQPSGEGMSPDANQLLMNLLGGPQADVSHSIPKLLADSSVLAQYGLITPPSSGGLNMGIGPLQRGGSTSQPPFMSPLNMPQGTQGSGPAPLSLNTAAAMGADGSMGSLRHPYTPLESPAVTPASVFSNMSLGTGGEQFFSPLTSPALHPQPNSYYPSKSRKSNTGSTPTASPLALQGKPGPLPRKNRSTTAEARANRQRPSPLIKPTVTGSVKRKKDSKPASPATSSQPTSRRTSVDGNHSRSSSQVATFTPIMAGASKPMDASPSEGAASTPSPIDISTAMGPPLSTAGGKPMTPGSLMGIGGSGGSSGEDSKRNSHIGSSRLRSDSKASTSSFAGGAKSASTSSSSSSSKGSKSKGKGSSSVTFAANAKTDPAAGEDGEEEEDEVEDPPRSSSQSNANANITNDSRRTSHKAAEQKRRDSLKYCFDELRVMLPPITLDEDAPGGSYLGPDGLTEDEDAEGFDRSEVMDPEFSRTANRAISKVALLRHSNEWIVRLRARLARRDAALAGARGEVEQLRAMLMANGIMPPPSAQQQQAQAQQQMQHAHHHAHQLHQHHPHQHHQQMGPAGGHFMMPPGGGGGGGGAGPAGMPAPGMEWK